MATMNDWIKEAEEQAKRYSDTLKQNNQYLIDQLNQSKKNTLDQLQSQQNNAIYNLNTNKASINQTATDNAKQINVAKLMALKSNQEAMNRGGLGTQGLVGSQANQINNDYGTNLTNILNQRTNDLRELEKQKNNTLLTYDTNRLNLENEYGNNLANLQQSINDKALSQYNTVYQNYLSSKQQEYENQQAELARQEAIRQYNENLALKKSQLEYQKQQDAIANAQKWASINNSYGSSGSGSWDFYDSSSNNEEFSNESNSNSNSNKKGLFGMLSKAQDIVNGKKYDSSYCADLSTKKANNWAVKKFYNVGKVTEKYLEYTLNQGLKNGTITQNDANEILKSYGM